MSIYLFDFHAVTLRQPCEMTWQFPVMTSESKYSCNESFLRDSFLCCLLCYFTWWQPHFLYQKRAIRVRQSESYLECNSSTPAVAHTNCILVNELKNTKAKEKLSQSCSKDTKYYECIMLSFVPILSSWMLASKIWDAIWHLQAIIELGGNSHLLARWLKISLKNIHLW